MIWQPYHCYPHNGSLCMYTQPKYERRRNVTPEAASKHHPSVWRPFESEFSLTRFPPFVHLHVHTFPSNFSFPWERPTGERAKVKVKVGEIRSRLRWSKHSSSFPFLLAARKICCWYHVSHHPCWRLAFHNAAAAAAAIKESESGFPAAMDDILMTQAQKFCSWLPPILSHSEKCVVGLLLWFFSMLLNVYLKQSVVGLTV